MTSKIKLIKKENEIREVNNSAASGHYHARLLKHLRQMSKASSRQHLDHLDNLLEHCLSLSSPYREDAFIVGILQLDATGHFSKAA